MLKPELAVYLEGYSYKPNDNRKPGSLVSFSCVLITALPYHRKIQRLHLKVGKVTFDVEQKSKSQKNPRGQKRKDEKLISSVDVTQ